MPPGSIGDPGRSLPIWVDGRTIGGDGRGGIPELHDGLPSGTGVYELVRVRAGRIELLREHAFRFLGSAAEIALPVPLDAAAIADAVTGLVSLAGERELLVKLSAVRRPGGTSLIIAPVRPLRHASRPLIEGFRLAIAPLVRDPRSVEVRAKLLPTPAETAGVLSALTSGIDSGIDEALVRNTAGRPCGALAANLHLVIDGALVTPPVEEGAYPGVTRATVIRAAAELSMPVEERPVRLDEVMRTREVFLTSTILGIASVAGIDGIPLPEPARPASIPKLRIRMREIASGRASNGVP